MVGCLRLEQAYIVFEIAIMDFPSPRISVGIKKLFYVIRYHKRLWRL